METNCSYFSKVNKGSGISRKNNFNVPVMVCILHIRKSTLASREIKLPKMENTYYD